MLFNACQLHDKLLGQAEQRLPSVLVKGWCLSARNLTPQEHRLSRTELIKV